MTSRIIPEDLIAEQVAGVDARVQGGPYADEAVEVRRAARFLDTLVERLGLRGPATSLTPPTGKPQYLLRLADSSGAPVVLKVYGRRRPAEAAVQRVWREHGVPTAKVLAHGDEPVSWLLMAELPGAPPATGSAELTPALARLMAHAHQVDIGAVPGTTRLFDAVARHLRAVAAAAAAHGYPMPEDLTDRSQALMTDGPRLCLHGDLTPVNLLVEGGSIHVLDTCGYVGPPEFDAARWCARVGGAGRARELLARWLAVETELDATRAAGLLALELVMEAGVREIVKDERGQDASAPDPATEALLAAAIAVDAP
ncbi:phosphotransferase family protein [Actinomycetospora soli]|uniref:phosphotransferase family protein n=1 Tax=Actinomycetospora soli TaxID=2893887 RepID=UPI001E4EE1C9|nr:phosphotransferase [Actinomycetospora soli]MCD2187865.1 phosphotransferase [Actinomycetospora soli]